MFIEFADEVRKKTNGSVDITVRAPGELPYTPPDYHRTVGRGEVAMADTAYLSSDVPATGALTNAFLVQNFDELEAVMPKLKPYVDGGLERFGAEVLFWWSYPPIKFWGVGEAPQAIDDFAGMKTRSISPAHQELLKKVGAVPVAVAAPEVMTALQYGTIDAAMTTAIAVVATKWEDVLDWGYILEVSPTPSYVIINSEMLNRLTEEERQVLRQAAAETQRKLLNLVQEREDADIAGLEERRMDIVRASDVERERLVEQSEVLWEDWAANHQDGKEIISTIRETVGR